MKKRILSLLLTLCMATTLLPATAFAEGGNTTPTGTEAPAEQGGSESKDPGKQPEAENPAPAGTEAPTEQGDSENKDPGKQPEAENPTPAGTEAPAKQGDSENKDPGKQPEAEGTPALQEGGTAGAAANEAVEIAIKKDLETDEDKGYTVEETKVPGADADGYGNEKKTVQTLTITQAGSYTIKQGEEAGTWRIVVAAASDTVELTLSNLRLDLSKTGYDKAYSDVTPKTAAGVPALEITGDCKTVITLEGSNTLYGGVYRAGLQNGTHAVTIKGEGSLETKGGSLAAGIGGSSESDGSNITIESGTVTATGGTNAAGIGGGKEGNGTNITIAGGTVVAKCPNNWQNNPTYAAGIGGGYQGDGTNITITGGKVTATGGSGAGIGGGGAGKGENITISGGEVTATSQKGAGIGGGQCGDGHNISVSGGTVTVSGGDSSADIGGGNGWSQKYPAGSASNIIISDSATVNKQGNGALDIGVANGGVEFLVIRDGKEITYTSKGDMSEIGNGETVKLLSNVELKDTESITVEAGKKLTLDLNGFTISQEKTTVENGHHSMITNNGTLTITDSSADKGGKITYTDSASYSALGDYSSNTITNKGSLTVTNCTIENNSPKTTAVYRRPYAIDNQSSDSSAATLTVENATVNTVRCPAIRLFCNSAEKDNTVTIRNSTIKGSIECQNPKNDSTKVKGSLTIESGTFPRNDGLGTSVYVFDGTDDKNVTDCSGMTCSISDGDFYGTVTFDGTVSNFNGNEKAREPFITGGSFHNGTRKAWRDPSNPSLGTEDVPLDTDPSKYVLDNGTTRIVKRDNGTRETYVYSVIPKSDLTDGVYLTDPSGALAEGYYVSSTEGGVWTVSPSTPPTRYTVTYTDGVDGEEIFQDQIYTVESGKATPAFNGTPTRKGYTFTGWKPAVAATVTGNATYEATWKSNSAATTSGSNTSSSGKTSSTGKTASPETGDTSPMLLWFALLFVSGGAVIGTTVVSRKKKYNR